MAAPFLIFLRNEDSAPDETFCREKIQHWILETYGNASFTLEKSDSSLIGGERENGYQDTYIRSVFLVIQLSDGRVWQVKMETEESSSDSFETSWRHSFTSIQFAFSEGALWAEMEGFLSKSASLMEALGFYHHTFDICADQLVLHCKEIQDQDGLEALKHYVLKAKKEEIIMHSAELGSIEIQNSPDLDIEFLLAAAPDKKSVISIAIQNNGLSNWPNTLFEFTQLCYLYIYNNPLQEIDERIGQLKELKLVNVHSCPFGKDPDKLNTFKALLPEGCEVQYF